VAAGLSAGLCRGGGGGTTGTRSCAELLPLSGSSCSYDGGGGGADVSTPADVAALVVALLLFVSRLCCTGAFAASAGDLSAAAVGFTVETTSGGC